RLALDFGDLTGEGLAYDTLRGTFQLSDGDAYTDNLTLRGSAAEIGIAGHTSLRHRTYDQTAIVTGQLGASLGVAGALAGGPAVGAALLLFSQIFKERLQGVTRGYYRITGTWDEPEVKRIDARELKDDRQAARAPS
ncbi:MAG: AsmA-like C-terminal region-containing protein, partial [Steroidobacteraceae bacterium]